MPCPEESLYPGGDISVQRMRGSVTNPAQPPPRCRQIGTYGVRVYPTALPQTGPGSTVPTPLATPLAALVDASAPGARFEDVVDPLDEGAHSNGQLRGHDHVQEW